MSRETVNATRRGALLYCYCPLKCYCLLYITDLVVHYINHGTGDSNTLGKSINKREVHNNQFLSATISLQKRSYCWV